MQTVKITSDHEGIIADHLDGDWEVKFVYDAYSVIVGVHAQSTSMAIYHAEERLPLEILNTTPEEIIVTLCGVYGGY